MKWMKKYHIIWIVIFGGLTLGFVQFQVVSSVVGEKDVKVYTYTKQFANLFLVQKDDRYLMIDAGLPNDSLGLLSFSEKYQIAPKKIEHLILTHAHPDHAGNAAFMQQKFGTKIIVGEGDISMIKAGGYDPQLCPRGLQGRFIKKTIESQRYKPFEPDILIAQKTSLRDFGWEGSIELFKSHTKGSLVIMMEDFAFVGDLIKGKNFNKSKPTFHIFMCDLSQNLQDLEKIAQNEQIKKWYLGHMGPLSREDVLQFVNRKK